MKKDRPSTLGFPCFHQIPTGLSFPDNFVFLDWILIFFFQFFGTPEHPRVSLIVISHQVELHPHPGSENILVDDHIDLAVAWSLTSPRTRTANSITSRVFQQTQTPDRPPLRHSAILPSRGIAAKSGSEEDSGTRGSTRGG